MTTSAENDARCSCGNRFDGDNLCMPSACQWEGLEDQRPPAEKDAGAQEPLTALDFVQMYLHQTEGHPQNGHYVNAVACRRKWKNKDDARSRCTRCDGEALLAASVIPPGEPEA